MRAKIITGLFICVSLVACSGSGDTYQGYVEADFVYVSAPVSGRLDSRPVERGQMVKADDLLFQLELDPEKAAVDEAEQRLTQSKSHIEDLKKGKRPSEIQALQAQIDTSKAALDLAGIELRRYTDLSKTNSASKRDYDIAKNNHASAEAKYKELEAQLVTARLGAREDEIEAAEADSIAKAQALEQLKWRLQQKSQRAPIEASVFDTLYEVGEWVAAGNPVLSLLPPKNIKVRFFVPQQKSSTLKLGQKIQIRVDGISEAVAGHISFVSPEVEFTPPVIFSRESRQKLVVLVEARPESFDAALKPGQPLDVIVDTST